MLADRTSRILRPSWALGLFTILLVLWAGLAVAAESHVPHGEGRLWRIERGGAPPSHIMGTIHLTDPRVRDLPAPIRKAFESSTRAAFEVLFTPEHRTEWTAAATLDSDLSLSDLLDKQAYERAVALGARYGLPDRAIKKAHPFFLTYFFSLSPEEHRRQNDGDLTLDDWLIQWAYDLGMRVEGLASFDEHMAVIDDVSLEDHAAMLTDTLNQLAEDPGGHEALIEDYLAGSMTRVYLDLEQAIRDDSVTGARAFKEAFLDVRNHTMVRRMIPLLKRGRAFVAVGALHMPGEEGILNLLEEQGYRVTRIY